MSANPVLRAVRTALATSIVLTVAPHVLAEVIFDGTVGPAGSLSGTMEITNDFGTQIGDNLFHSFSLFNVNTGESATFTSTFSGITDNVIARVTGGSLSTIDGPLASSIPGASLWLINPSGVVFGDNASLSVNGAFHVSTADYLVLEDGARFDASNPPATVLSMADPAAFGFIGPSIAPITIGNATLDAADAMAVSLIGGDIALNGTILNAPGGRVNVASVADGGVVSLEANGIGISGITQLGDISLDGAEIVTSADSGGDIYIRGGRFLMDQVSYLTAATLGTEPTDAGGDISLIVDDATILNSSQISATTFGGGNAGDITVDASGDILIQGDIVDSPAGIFSNSRDTATGDGGTITVNASNLSIIEGGIVGSITFGAGSAGVVDINLSEQLYMRSTLGLFDADILANGNAFFGASGDVGAVTIDAPIILMEQGALIQAETFDGSGGNLEITTDSLTITGGSQISTSTSGIGDGGSMVINAGDVSISGFQFVPAFNGFIVSGLYASTGSSGSGGSINLNATDLTLSDFAVINNFVAFGGSGDGGPTNIDVDRLTIRNGAFLAAGTSGPGTSGDLDISASESILIDGQFLTFPNFTGIFANSFGNGNAGRITVTTPDLEIRDGGFIQAGSFASDASASGNASDIIVNVGDLRIDAGFISATTWTSGDAGTITVNAERTVTLENSSGHVFTDGNPPIGGLTAQSGSFFTSALATGAAGGIAINADELIIRDGGVVSSDSLSAGSAGTIEVATNILDASATENPFTGLFSNSGFGGAEAGSININAGNMTISGLASIQAATFGAGPAGSIIVDAENVSLIDGGSLVARTLGSGRGGTIDINVRDAFRATGDEASAFGNVSTASNAAGDGGSVRIAADSIILENNAQISAAAASDGSGGDITIMGRIVDIASGSEVSASATGNGNAGTVFVIAVDELLVDNASIETSSELSAGGNIRLNVGTNLFMNDGATITAAANGVTPDDDGGNITIDPVFVVLRESQILASANAGNGGNISIQAGSFIIDAESVIDASSQTGLDGQITIDSVNNVFGTVVLLEARDVQVPDVVTQRCVAQAFRDRSSLTVESADTAVWSPDDYAPSPQDAAAISAALPSTASAADECLITLTLRSGADAS